MGYEEATPHNKINIHVGGTYATHGDKEATMQRWAAGFRQLSPRCRARMTGEAERRGRARPSSGGLSASRAVALIDLLIN